MTTKKIHKKGDNYVTKFFCFKCQFVRQQTQKARKIQ